VEVQGPIRHLVPKELWVYYDKLVGLLTSHPAAVTPVTSAPSAAGGSGLGGPGGSSISRVRWEAPPAATSSMPLGHLPSLTSSQPLPSLPSGAASSSRPLPAAAGAPPAAAAAGASAARSHAAMVRAALASVSSDTGLHPLTPYFVNFIAEGVRKHVGDLEVLPRLLGLARALLANKDLHLAPYLKQLLPAVMTALLTSPLGECRPGDWCLQAGVLSLCCWCCSDVSCAGLGMACSHDVRSDGGVLHNASIISVLLWRLLGLPLLTNTLPPPPPPAPPLQVPAPWLPARR
jgi:hypothetical protein